MKRIIPKYNVKAIYGFGSVVAISTRIKGRNCPPVILDLFETDLPHARLANQGTIFDSFGACAEKILLSCLEEMNGEVVVLTDIMKKYLKQRGIDKNIIVAYDGTDPNLFEPIDFQFKKDNPTIVFTGDIDIRDGVHILIKAFAQVVKELKVVKLYVIGDGPLLPKLRKLATKLKLNRNIIFTGWMPFSRLIGILPRFSVGVVPSTQCLLNNLAIPRKTFEFMAAGLPVIAPNLESMREIIKDGTSGILYKPDGQEALSESILKPLTDERLYETLQKNGREIAEKYSVHKEVTKIEKLMCSYMG